MSMRHFIIAIVALGWASAAIGAEELPAPEAKTGSPPPVTTPEQFAQEKALVGDKPRPAPAKPLPVYPYAGGLGLTVTQLADKPGNFNQNVPLQSSVPGPVLLPQIADVPFAPPYVSPAFVPSASSPPPGTPAPYPTHSVTGRSIELNDLTMRLGRYNTAVDEFETQLQRPQAWTAQQLGDFDLRLKALQEERATLALHLDKLPTEQRARLAALASLDPATRLLDQAHAPTRQNSALSK